MCALIISLSTPQGQGRGASDQDHHLSSSTLVIFKI
jgi:hypothetical protein